jgi:hypothetical protein
MIREARPDDMGRILELGERFFVESGWHHVAPWDAMSFVETVERLDSDGVLLVSDDEGRVTGMAGAPIYPAYFNRNVRLSQEMFWYVDPAHRRGRDGIRLFEGMEAGVAAKGARTFTMGALAGHKAMQRARFYQRHDYKPIELSFIKRL